MNTYIQQLLLLLLQVLLQLAKASITMDARRRFEEAKEWNLGRAKHTDLAGGFRFRKNTENVIAGCCAAK